MSNQIVVLGENKHYDTKDALPPIDYRSKDDIRIAYISMQQRLDDFNGMPKKQREEFLKKENTTEDKWIAQTLELGDLFLSKFILTFEEYDAYCYDANRRLPEDQGWGRDRRPAVNINIVDTIDYCNWINRKAGLSDKYILAMVENEVWVWTYPGAEKLAKDYITEEETTIGRKLTADEKIALVQAKCHQRIPTSAEWIASLNRPNETFQYPGSDKLEEVAWFKDNSNNMTHPVGELKSNSYGVYDMYGNTWEMCLPQHPPVMTEAIWKQNWPNIPYLDRSNDEIFNVIQD